jgi:ABC-type transporter Mla subunit MlaD
LLIDLSSLAKSTQNLVSLVQHDLPPTMKELKKALININSIASSTNSQFSNLNTALNEGLNIISHSSRGVVDKAKVALSSLRQGVMTGLKVFLDNNRHKNS